MKKLLLVLCCISLIIASLSGCNSEAVLLADNERYDLVKKGKELYWVIDESIFEEIDARAKYSDPKLCISYATCLWFDSIEEFLDTIKNGKLEENHLVDMCRFLEYDSNYIKICDIFNLQVPVLPDGWEVNRVKWGGTDYSFDFFCSTGEVGSLHYKSKEIYESQYEREYLNFFDQEHITLEKTVKNKNKTEYYYSTKAGEFKRVRYTVKNGKTTLIVDEDYLLSTTSQLLEDRPVSDTIPYSVQIYGRKSNHYFKIYLYNLVEQPTEEWIKSFGIKDYE